MSEEIEIDILQDLQTTDLTNVETGMPVLKEGLKELEVTEIKVEPNKKGNGNNLKIKLSLVDPDEDIRGKPISAGFPLFHIISLVKTDKYDPLIQITQFKECFTGSKSGSFFPLEQYLAQRGNVHTKNKGDSSSEYGIQTRITRWVKKA